MADSGNDLLHGGDGNDRFFTRGDGAPNMLLGGAGDDQAERDDIDSFTAD